MARPLDTDTVVAFKRDGAVCLRGVFSEWIDTLAEGVERNEIEPSSAFAENVPTGERGRFWDDYCNWNRIPAFERFAFESAAAELAAGLMQAETVQLFHDHVLVKEPATPTLTPWHSDRPYYFVDGTQTISFWIPLDPVSTDTTLRLIAGSHRWERDVLPVKWLAGDDFYPNADDYLPVPDPDADPDQFEVLEWALEPGDAVAFDFGVCHGSRGNPGGARRRAFSLRLFGDDARYVSRPGPTSPPFPEHGMSDGDRLRPDWFPYLIGGP
ncbi:MAG: phytanoyl-CoA dioxygenase family protein [Acidimicrobiales bacterium]|nr:phytanoyl-CoA dioxygenase family protein [Acidimicrobiales bacterium]MDG1878197.1 phytanoyl-CoA dioxygenase family protein [Acidimicrobiales bacterium]